MSRAASHDADTVADEMLSGATDQVIAIRTQAEGRVLLTLDLDFCNVQVFDPAQYAGIIVLRLHRQDKPTVLSYVRRVVAAIENRSPVGCLWIVQKDRIRFRAPV